MKPWQTSLKQSTQQRGKRRNKEEDSSLIHKSETQSGSLHATGTNLKSHNAQKAYQRKRLEFEKQI